MGGDNGGFMGVLCFGGKLFWDREHLFFHRYGEQRCGNKAANIMPHGFVVGLICTDGSIFLGWLVLQELRG